MNIKVILGSVRSERTGDRVANWVMKELEHLQDNHTQFELIDLAELNLPFMDEPAPPMMSDGYQHDHTKAWSKTVSEADGFIFVTPEYNHGYSPVLKNAVDYLYQEWKDKPLGFVGYGAEGAGYSIDQMKQVAEFVGLKPVKHQVGISQVWAALDDAGNIKEEVISGEVSTLAAELKNSLLQKAEA